MRTLPLSAIRRRRGSGGCSHQCASKATGYSPDESHWAIVVVEPEAMRISKFKRSEKLDILASHEIQSEHKSKFAEGFESANCSSLQKAAITKIESKGRIFLTMGEVK